MSFKFWNTKLQNQENDNITVDIFKNIDIEESKINKQYDLIQWNLFFVIDNSINKIIDEKQADIYFKEWVYNTLWEYKEYKIIIFDLEKNSILPEVRFLDKYWKEWWGWNFWITAIIVWIILFWIIAYSFLWWDKEEETKSNEIITPVINNNKKDILDFIKKDENIDITKNNIEKNILIESKPVKNTFSLIESNNDLELNNIKSDLYFCNIEKDLILSEKNIFNDRVIFLENKEIKTDQENINLFNSLKVCRSDKQNLIEEKIPVNIKEKTFYKVWKQLFHKCKEKENPACDKVFNQALLNEIEDEENNILIK